MVEETQQILCHLCGEDLSENGTPKYLTHFSHDLPEGAKLCSKCHNKEFQISHLIYRHQQEKKAVYQEKQTEISRFHKLFGNLYIKI